MELKILMIDAVVNSGIASPEIVNYRHLGFYIKETMAKGVITKNEFYKNFDGNVFSDLYVEENFTYAFNGIYYTGSTTVVKWYNIDDQVGFENSHTKLFSLPESRNFGQNKRKNILAITEFTALGTLGYVNGSDLMTTLAIETKDYVDGAPTAGIVSAINAQVGVKVYLTQQFADTLNAILTNV